jgi:hypothetical protein
MDNGLDDIDSTVGEKTMTMLKKLYDEKQ